MSTEDQLVQLLNAELEDLQTGPLSDYSTQFNADYAEANDEGQPVLFSTLGWPLGSVDTPQLARAILAARQPSEDDRLRVAEIRHRRAYSVYGEGTAYEDIGWLLDTLSRAAVPDAATEREIAIIEDHREKWMARAFRAEDERDAALAAIERVRAIHLPVALETKTVCNSCAEEWPCDTREALVAAQGAAPQAESEYEHLLKARALHQTNAGLPSSGVDEDVLAEVIESIIRENWEMFDDRRHQAEVIARAVAERLETYKEGKLTK